MIETGLCHVNRSSRHTFDRSYQFSLKFNFIFSSINYGNYPSLILKLDFNTRNAKDGILRQRRGIQFFLRHHTWKVAGSNPIGCLAGFCDSTWLRNVGLPKSRNSENLMMNIGWMKLLLAQKRPKDSLMTDRN